MGSKAILMAALTASVAAMPGTRAAADFADGLVGGLVGGGDQIDGKIAIGLEAVVLRARHVEAHQERCRRIGDRAGGRDRQAPLAGRPVGGHQMYRRRKAAHRVAEAVAVDCRSRQQAIVHTLRERIPELCG